MRVMDLFGGRKRVLTPLGIIKMGKLHDVEGLVDILDKVDRPLRVHVLDQLVALSEKNRFDQMMDVGVIGKLLLVFQEGSWNERKRAALLLSSFILHQRIHRVLKHDWTMKALISQMGEADDILRKNLTYCIYEFCRRNLGHQVVYHNGIPAIVESMRSEDPDVHYWALYSMSCIASLGYQELILRTDLLPMLNRDLGSMDGEVHSLAEMLVDNIYNWRDMESEAREAPAAAEKEKRSGYEDLGVTDGYHRPGTRSQRPASGKGSKLTTQGSKVRNVKDDDVEVIMDLDEAAAEKEAPRTAYENLSEDDEDDFVIEI
ncbi:MAG: hypothetical protein ACMUHM_01900 [Thermoplasmatota archaeon]